MKLKVEAWSRDDWKRNLAKRLSYAQSYRREHFESQWKTNDELFYNGRTYDGASPISAGDDGYTLDFDAEDTEASAYSVAINYCFKYIRFMHSQMAANPPSVKWVPHTTDIDDIDRAENASRAGRHLREKLEMADISDQRNLKTLVKGTGYIISEWDATRGRALEFNKETGDLLMSGDHRTYSPSTWNVWLDPDATTDQDVRWFFELVPMPLDEALQRFPDSADALRRRTVSGTGTMRSFFRRDTKKQRAQDIVEVYRFVEKGLPVNGMIGRAAWCLDDGTILGEPGENPNPDHRLGLNILTDIDIEDCVYGASIIEFVAEIQEVLNALDSNVLYNLASHNVVRMVVDASAGMEDDAITDDASTITKIKGNVNGVKFAPTPTLMPDGWRFREQLQQGSQEVAGVNESMMGQINRETSGYTFQQAINAGNMVRTRLFNKYTRAIKMWYQDLMAIAIQHWDIPQTIRVLGEEHAYEVYEFDQTDLKGGWDIVAEYGTNLSLDPRQARDDLVQLLPVLEKIPGFSYRQVPRALRLDFLDQMVDGLELAARREKEEIQKIIRRYVDQGVTALDPPEADLPADYREAMLEYAYRFRMSAQFARLDDGLKDIIRARIRAHEDAMADIVAKAQGPATPEQSAAPLAPPAQIMPGM